MLMYLSINWTVNLQPSTASSITSSSCSIWFIWIWNCFQRSRKIGSSSEPEKSTGHRHLRGLHGHGSLQTVFPSLSVMDSNIKSTRNKLENVLESPGKGELESKTLSLSHPQHRLLKGVRYAEKLSGIFYLHWERFWLGVCSVEKILKIMNICTIHNLLLHLLLLTPLFLGHV